MRNSLKISNGVKTRDRLFIILTIVLLILFLTEIFLNLPRSNLDKPLKAKPRQIRIDEILARLEQAGLEPKEAKYYSVQGETLDRRSNE